MNQGKLFEQILNPANRHNPYPLYAQLRETPISQQEDGTYVVSTYREIEALLYDPRISSDERKSTYVASRFTTARVRQRVPESSLPFILLDPPDHNRLRRAVMHQFTPERVEGMRARVIQIVDELLDAQRNRSQLDIVALCRSGLFPNCSVYPSRTKAASKFGSLLLSVQSNRCIM